MMVICTYHNIFICYVGICLLLVDPVLDTFGLQSDDETVNKISKNDDSYFFMLTIASNFSV